MNYITIIGRVSKVGELHRHEHTGAVLHIHMSDGSEFGGNVWFLVRVRGKVAERINGTVENGDIATVIGRVSENMADGSRAVIIDAKDFYPHIQMETYTQ